MSRSISADVSESGGRPEFSRRLPLARLSGATASRPLQWHVDANAAECRALAARLQIPSVASLHCSFELASSGAGEVEAQGQLRAEVTQLCVVSLEAFEATVQERFAVRFVPQGSERDDPDPEAPDEIAYPGDSIDLGEAAAEQLALALDPFPRKPGVALPVAAAEDRGEATQEPGRGTSGLQTPFAALDRLRRNGA